MAELGQHYVSVCSTEGRQNFVQPYMWLGIEDLDGKGIWRDMYTKDKIKFMQWDEVKLV
jgi:hypothetical protein